MFDKNVGTMESMRFYTKTVYQMRVINLFQMLKTNPLLKFSNMGSDFMQDSGMSDSGNDNTLESSKSSHNNSNMVNYVMLCCRLCC